MYRGNFIILLHYQLPTAGDLGSIPTLPVSARQALAAEQPEQMDYIFSLFNVCQCISINI
jgi:hypothetical protein